MNVIDRVVKAGGLDNDAALAGLWGISRASVSELRSKNWLPIKRARDACRRWPELKIRDLVKPEIRAAMTQDMMDR